MAKNPKRRNNKGIFVKGHKVNLGRKHSKKWNLKCSLAHKGKIFSIQHKQNLLKRPQTFRKGDSPWNKGKKGCYKVSEITRKKIGKANKGEKSHFWKGGVCPKNLRIRKSLNFCLWRESVFVRDNWTCQKCMVKGGIIHPHHIQNFAQYPELRFALDNGITLCKNCHRSFHKRYGIKNNNKKQMKGFLNEK